MIWRSHSEPEGFAYVLFGDCVPADCMTEVASGAPLLDDGIGRLFVEQTLETFRVMLI
ncbi:MAG: hypothetical protein OXH19_07675 [Chloroflexi bacterium]|nr:hypothetical protein [Chloroflexota bacterium]MCY3589392.1 hypothetical protein [Chloroflexota bacterium]MCY3686069.1 hypothetical protein [Chloroflexota bacterium]MDE2709259.1 hypothetical protein [Chloroflexota bacterium]